jgi:hypothetical protein
MSRRPVAATRRQRNSNSCATSDQPIPVHFSWSEECRAGQEALTAIRINLMHTMLWLVGDGQVRGGPDAFAGGLHVVKQPVQIARTEHAVALGQLTCDHHVFDMRVV